MSVIDVPYGQRVEQNGRSRKCKWPDCNTKLNSYNPNSYCHAHAFKGACKDLRVNQELAAIRTKAYAHRKSKHKG